MTDTMRYRYGATNPILVPVDSAQVIEIGDLVWLNTDDARPASAQADQLSEAANQREFKRLFLGIAMQRSRSGDTDPIRIATNGVFEFDAVSATYEIGDLVGVDEDSGGTYLTDQQVAAVALSDLSIGKIARRETSATNSVFVDIHSTVLNKPSPSSSDVLLVGNTAVDRAQIKGIYMTPANVSVTVPSITDPDTARVQVDVSAALSFQPTLGDAVIAMPITALMANCRLSGAYVYATDGVELAFTSEGGNVTGAAHNFKFLFFDLT